MPRTRAAPYHDDVMLHHGAPATAVKLSAYLGTPFTLNVDDDEQAIHAISSEERRDNPCFLWIGTEKTRPTI